MKQEPAVAAGKPQPWAGVASTAPGAARSSVRPQGAGLSPAGRRRGQGTILRANTGRSMDAPTARTSGTAFLHSKMPRPTRGWEQQLRGARDGAATGTSTSWGLNPGKTLSGPSSDTTEPEQPRAEGPKAGSTHSQKCQNWVHPSAGQVLVEPA